MLFSWGIISRRRVVRIVVLNDDKLHSEIFTYVFLFVFNNTVLPTVERRETSSYSNINWL